MAPRRNVVVVEPRRQHHGGGMLTASVVGMAVGGGLGYMAGKKSSASSATAKPAPAPSSSAYPSTAAPSAPPSNTATQPPASLQPTIYNVYVAPAPQPGLPQTQYAPQLVYQPAYASYGGVQSLGAEGAPSYASYGGQQVWQPGA
eukprot:g43253.t1